MGNGHSSGALAAPVAGRGGQKGALQQAPLLPPWNEPDAGGTLRNTVKIGILAVFGPKPWTPPPRRAENGPPASFDDQPNGPVRDARPEPGFSGFLAFFGLRGVRAGSQ